MQAHYIIFHPERQKINANVKVLRNNLIYEGNRDIYVDPLKNGTENEDPFVFSNPWLYSYCHADHNIKRAPNNTYVQPNSYLIFVDKDEAKEGFLKIDTIFLVDNVLVWPEKGNKPPVDYSCRKGDVWFRHIRHGIRLLAEDGHKGEYTYEAKMYKYYKKEFSYLPLMSDKKIEIASLNNGLFNMIKENKYNHPFSIEIKLVQTILSELNKISSEKVIEVIGIISDYKNYVNCGCE